MKSSSVNHTYDFKLLASVMKIQKRLRTHQHWRLFSTDEASPGGCSWRKCGVSLLDGGGDGGDGDGGKTLIKHKLPSSGAVFTTNKKTEINNGSTQSNQCEHRGVVVHASTTHAVVPPRRCHMRLRVPPELLKRRQPSRKRRRREGAVSTSC